MGHMKLYKCNICKTTRNVIVKKHRGTSIQYFCKSCKKYFSVDTYFVNGKELMNLHLDGLSCRDIARKTGISKSQVYRIIKSELQKIPDNNKFTFNYCSRFSRIFEFDGTYINVKGFKRGIVMLWGVDYFRHDFPVITFAKGESEQGWGVFFETFRILNSYPDYIVCDDNENLKKYARIKFPKVKVQMCYNHFKEGLRRDLKVRSEETYRKFMHEIEMILACKRSERDFDFLLHRALVYYIKDPVCTSIIVNMAKRKNELLAFTGIKNAPVTTNMIEGFHQQIKDRIDDIHHFESFHHAKLWLNAFVLKRRFTKFESCKGRFANLNGKYPLQLTKNPEVDLPTFF